MIEEIKNYIGGESVAPLSGNYLDNWNPAVGEVYSRVPDSDEKDVEQAIAAARGAFPAWSETPAAERTRILRRLAREIEKQSLELARAESIDTGKPLKLASTVDIPRSVLNFEFFADMLTAFSSESHMMDRIALNYTQRSPLGVVACISPWNLPLYLLTWKIAPALAAGNTVVAKPSEVTPMTAYRLGEICRQVGLPPGVLNIVHGLGSKTGPPLCSHKDVAAVSFTGSTQTGFEISRLAVPYFKKISLEMGGKNPNIIFSDCDFDEALAGTLRAAFSNQGQICLCGSRIFVERPIYEKFKKALIEKTANLRVGDPMDERTDQGSLVSKNHFEKVMSCIELAKKEGGQILIGGNRAVVEGRCRNGWFVQPTLIEGLGPACRTNQEEIFGPVATLAPFDKEEEVVEAANSTRYGLAASVWTRDIKRAHRVAGAIRSGVVWVNSWMLRDLRIPFGGMKDSGVGREGGWESMRFFTEPKNICVKL